MTNKEVTESELQNQENNTPVDDVLEAIAEEAAATDEAAAPLSLELLQQQLAEAQAKAQEHWDTILRQQAEQENLRKRMARDVEQARKYALERFATELLAVRDSLEMGVEAAQNSEVSVESLREGSELILKMLSAAMDKFEIAEINPLGQKFDPHVHEAMAMAPDPTAEANTVLMVQQKGYQLHERLLRPARVIVAKAP
jgi:molecular chaperone GrpE